MKKSVKKLVLNRETLHSMEQGLRQVAGGASVFQREDTECNCYSEGCYPATACFGSCSCG